jgi:hypothetical protein
MEDETYHETGNEYRPSNTNSSSPEHKLTARKLERHNQAYSGNDYDDDRSPRSARQSMFPAASVLATARSNRLSNSHRLVSSGRSDAGTQHSTMSVAESVISRATAKKGKF